MEGEVSISCPREKILFVTNLFRFRRHIEPDVATDEIKGQTKHHLVRCEEKHGPRVHGRSPFPRPGPCIDNM